MAAFILAVTSRPENSFQKLRVEIDTENGDMPMDETTYRQFMAVLNGVQLEISGEFDEEDEVDLLELMREEYDS